MVLEFKDVVRESYESLFSRNGEAPTAEMVAEDIVENYEGYHNINLNNPMKHYNWVMEVSFELGRQGLEF